MSSSPNLSPPLSYSLLIPQHVMHGYLSAPSVYHRHTHRDTDTHIHRHSIDSRHYASLTVRWNCWCCSKGASLPLSSLAYWLLFMPCWLSHFVASPDRHWLFSIRNLIVCSVQRFIIIDKQQYPMSTSPSYALFNSFPFLFSSTLPYFISFLLWNFVNN